MSDSNVTIDKQKLIQLSKEVMKNSYCVYSNFPVGVALLCSDGAIYTGVNVENASYGLGICAERTAAVKAVSEGHRKFIAVAVSSSKLNDYIYPCGACRQFLSEFGGAEMKVLASKPDASYTETTLGELLPNYFTREQLK